MGLAVASTEEGTLVEKAGSQGEYAGVTAVVGQEGSRVGVGYTDFIVVFEEPFEN